MYTIKLASLEEFHLPSLGDFWTYSWRLLSDCSVLAVWSNLNQQPIHSHLPRQRGSCKQISPTFVTYPASFLNAVFPLFCWILNYATYYYYVFAGGSGAIRTPVPLAGQDVFKTSLVRPLEYTSNKISTHYFALAILPSLLIVGFSLKDRILTRYQPLSQLSNKKNKTRYWWNRTI